MTVKIMLVWCFVCSMLALVVLVSHLILQLEVLVMSSCRMTLMRTLTKWQNAVNRQHRQCSDGRAKDRKFFLRAASITGRHAYEWLRG